MTSLLLFPGRKNEIRDVEKGDKGGCGQDETSSDTSQYPEYLNYGEEDEMEIEGYVRSSGKTFVTWLFIILSVGLLRLIFHWWPRLMLYATHIRSPLVGAEKVLITVS
jgi:cation-transporting ATPase 13A2